jgi:hypothetical protein
MAYRRSWQVQTRAVDRDADGCHWQAFELLVLGSGSRVAGTERIFAIDGAYCGYCHTRY